MMSNLCNPTPTLSNTAEIVESKLSFKFTPLQSNRFGCYSLWEVSSHLEFTITLSSNDLIPEQKYSKKQDVLYQLIKYLRDEKGLGYRKISHKLNSWGIKTPRGKKWFNTSVHSVLKRRKQRDLRIDNQRNQKYPIEIGKLTLNHYPF